MKFIFVVGKIIVKVIKGVGCMNNDGEVNVFDDVYSFFEVVG